MSRRASEEHERLRITVSFKEMHKLWVKPVAPFGQAKVKGAHLADDPVTVGPPYGVHQGLQGLLNSVFHGQLSIFPNENHVVVKRDCNRCRIRRRA